MTEQTNVYEPTGVRARGEGPARDDVGVATRRSVAVAPEVGVGENVMPVRDRVQWGPILAGLLTGLATLIVLTVLGLAIGTSAFEPGKSHGLGTAAGIWGAVSAIVAFFVGGWVAAKTAAVGGRGSGLMNGLMVGAAALALILYLTTTGVANLVGTIGANLGDIANVVQDQAQSQGVTVDDATSQQTQGQVQDATNQVQSIAKDNYDSAKKGAWGTLIALLLALGASALGGITGYNQRRDLITGTG